MEGVTLLVGTTKGAFIFNSGGARKKWKARGPFFSKDPGGLTGVFHLATDRRQGGRVYAAVNSGIYGPKVFWTDDMGESWKESPKPPRFPRGSKLTVKNLWHVTPGREDEPQTLYLGADPHALFESRDGGSSWEVVSSITYHEDRKGWTPGFGGPCLHTIVVDRRSKRGMWVGLSSAGVYHTSDFKKWKPMNRGIRADFRPDKYPVFGQCVHKFALNADGRTLFLQNHGGVYRSEDYGETWKDVGKGLPNDFGFALAAHPTQGRTFYVVPLDGMTRFNPRPQFAVYRTADGGGSWEGLGEGLPKKAYLTVLREGMCSDGQDPAGIYVGAKSGTVYFSRDNGDHWETLAENLPPILSVSSG